MPPTEPLSRPRLCALGALLMAPYLLNDLANIYVYTPVAWLACDYGSRLFSLACLAWAVQRGAMRWEDLSLGRAPWWRIAIAGFVATAVGLLLNAPPAKAALWNFSSWQVGGIPFIHPPWLRDFDCYAGIALVAVSEECVFRGALPALCQRLGVSPVAAWLVCSALFGLAHWSLGLGAIAQTAVIGASFGLMAQFGRSLWPVIVAHFIVDFVEFSGMPPIL